MEIELKEIFKNEIKKNRLQKKENKDIMNIFLNNIKETKAEIIQTRELPKIPIIPALLNKLPDAINNTIFYYVGYKSRLSKIIEYPIKNIPIYLRNKRERTISYACRLYCNTLDVYTKEPRREGLLKLPQWVQKQMDAYLKDKSLRKQIGDLVPFQNYRRFNTPDLVHCREFSRRELTKQLQLCERDYNYFDWQYSNEKRLLNESINDCNDECDFID
jgi:hypothetical protein